MEKPNEVKERPGTVQRPAAEDELYSTEERKQWGEQKAQERGELEEKIKSIMANYTENPENILELLEFGSRFYKYSARNNMLIHNQNPYATYVQNFQEWIKAGWPVKKRETGLWIYHPEEYRALITEEGPVPWKKASDEQKEAYRKGELKGEKRIGFRLRKTFDISQTHCPPKEYPQYYHMGYASTEHAVIAKGLEVYAKDALQTIVTTEDVKSISLKGQAEIAPRQDGYWHIKLSDKLNDTEVVSTLSHEIGHQLMHRSAAAKPVALMEMESDCFSIMLQHHLGLDVSALANRQRHLVNSFKAWQKFQEDYLVSNPGATAKTLDAVINDVFRVYRQEIDKINSAINTAKEQETVKDVVKGEPAKARHSAPQTDNDILPTKQNVSYEYAISIVPVDKIDTVLMEECSATAAGALKHYHDLSNLPCMSNPNIKLEVLIRQTERAANGADVKEYYLTKAALEKTAYHQARADIISHLRETGEPMVLFKASESSFIADYTYMNLRDANSTIYQLNKAVMGSEELPARLDYQIYYMQEGQFKAYQGSYVIGEEAGKTITLGIEERANIRLQDKTTALEKIPQYEMIKNEFVPYLEQHEQLSALEIMANYALTDDETSLAAREHAAKLPDYIAEQRTCLNSGAHSLNLERMPQLKEHKDYRMGPSRSSVAMEFRNHGYVSPTKEQIDSMIKLNKLSIKQTGNPLSLDKVHSICSGKELAYSKELNAAAKEVGDACKKYEATQKEMLHQPEKWLPPTIG